MHAVGGMEGAPTEETKTFNVGFGTAAGLYQSLFGFLLVLLVNWIIRRIDADYALF